MRQKTAKAVVSFATSSDALAVQAAARASNIPGRIIPAPASITASCGLAWCVDMKLRGVLVRRLDAHGLAYEALHEVELY